MDMDVDTDQDLNVTLDGIMRDLDVGMWEFPEAALREAQRYRQEITPRLMETIRSATTRAATGDLSMGNAHLFATFLLTEFRDKEALPAILEAISLPGDLPFDLYGDAITEDLAGVLAVLAEDAPELIEALISNRALNQFVRWAAADTFLYFVRDGRLTRDQAVERLHVHLREAIANEDRDVAGSLVIALDNFSPREALEDIRQAYALDLVDRRMLWLSSVEESVADGDARVQESLAHCPPTGFDDAVEHMRGWYRHAETDKRREQLLKETAALGPELDLNNDWPHPDTIVHTAPRVGRNDSCPCGSGKKFKKCCGRR